MGASEKKKLLLPSHPSVHHPLHGEGTRPCPLVLGTPGDGATPPSQALHQMHVIIY